MQIPSIPLNILALAPVAPIPAAGYHARLVPVDIATLDEALADIGPRLFIPLPLELCPEGSVTLEISSIKDFKPDTMVKKLPFLARTAEAGKYVSQALSGGTTPDAVAKYLKENYPELPLNVSASKVIPFPKKNKEVDDILSMVAMPDSGERPSAADVRKSRDIKTQIDDILASLLHAIFENPEFKTCESAWRGVETMVKQAPVREGQGVNLTLVPVSLDTLETALEELTEMLADDLPDLVLIDLPLDSSPRSTDIMEKIAEFGDNLFAPVACWITSKFFFLDDWTGLKKVAYIKHHLEDGAFAKWKKLKESPGANWLCVTLNRFLTRLPYGRDNKPKGVYFEETPPLWLSPVWAMGTLAAQSTLNHGWPSRFTDYVNVTLRDLPLADFSQAGAAATEMHLSEDRLMEFIDAGMTPLYGPLRKDTAFLPKEVNAAEGSFKFQMFTSRILGFLFWCRENLAVEQGDLAGSLKTALSMYWQRTGHKPPADLDVKAGPETDDHRIPLNISMTPPTSVLPGGHHLEFTFAW